MLETLKNKIFAPPQNKAAAVTSDEVRSRIARLDIEQTELRRQSGLADGEIASAYNAISQAEAAFIGGGINSDELTELRTEQLGIISAAEAKKVGFRAHLALIDKAFQGANTTLREILKAESIVQASVNLEQHREWRLRFSEALARLLALNDEGREIEMEIQRQHPGALSEIYIRMAGTAGQYHAIGALPEFLLPRGTVMTWLRSVAATHPEDLHELAHVRLDNAQLETDREANERRTRAKQHNESQDAHAEMEKFAVIKHDFALFELDKVAKAGATN